MPNALETPTLIAKDAVMRFLNELNMTGFVDRQLDGTMKAQKAGNSMLIRKVTRFIAQDGADITGNIQDIVDGTVTLTLDTFKSVPISLSSTELTLDLKNFGEQVSQPAVEELAQTVESLIAGLYKQVWNQVGTPGTTPSTLADAMLPKTQLDNIGVPKGNRSSFYNPTAAGLLASVLGGVFPTTIAERAITEGAIRRYAGFEFMQNQSIVQHTVGAHAGTPLIDGANQDVLYTAVKNDYKQVLNTKGWTISIADLLLEGDRFTIADVFEVNPKTRQTTGNLQKFVVRADAASDGSGDSILSISPPIIDSGAFQTVNAAPADNAAITVIGTASTTYPQNIAMHKNAFTLAFAQLELPMGGAKAGRTSESGVSIRVIMQYNVLTDQNIIRYDILVGALAQNPGFATIHVG